MNAKEVEKIIAARFKGRSGYDNSFIIAEAAQDVAAALQPDVSGLVEPTELMADAGRFCIPTTVAWHTVEGLRGVAIDVWKAMQAAQGGKGGKQ